MKIKMTEPIPSMNNHCGLSREVWEKLNAGKIVEVDSIPDAADPYVTEVTKKAKATNGN